MTPDRARLRAAARLHQALFTGLLLRLLMEKGEDAGAAFLFETFRAQHDEKFLPALATLGVDGEPDAVACAHFFYVANKAGGVNVECMVENDRKAWIRYPPPRWAYTGAAICAVPDAVTVGMLRGFHARCGESLGNPRLGFVCTKTTTAGQPGLEGYFREFDRDLAPDERLQFARDADGPRFDPDSAPALDGDEDRLAKAGRNYALTYIRQMLPAIRKVAGDVDGAAIAGRAARQVGMQLFTETAALVGPAAPGAAGFADHLEAMLTACGDAADPVATGTGAGVEQKGWRLMAGQAKATDADFEAWSNLWRGACAVHDPALDLTVAVDGDRESPISDRLFRWTLSAR